MSAVDRILERLSRRPDVKWERDGDVIRVHPADDLGFEVLLVADEGRWTVIFRAGESGWHEDFDTEEGAAECFAFGLSDGCRLRTWSRHGRPFRWTVEARTDEGWVPARTTGLLFASVDQAEVHLRSNAFVRLDASRADEAP